MVLWPSQKYLFKVGAPRGRGAMVSRYLRRVNPWRVLVVFFLYISLSPMQMHLKATIAGMYGSKDNLTFENPTLFLKEIKNDVQDGSEDNVVATLSLKQIKNNVNATFPLEHIKGEHPALNTSNSSSRNSTLVVVWGDVRSSEQAWETLYKQVLDVHSADLALIVQRPALSYQGAKPSLYSRAKYVWEYHDFGFGWDIAIDLIGISEENGTSVTWRDVANKSRIALGGYADMPKGSGAIIFTLRWFAQNCLEQILPYYDRFVFTRIDHLYFCPDPSLEKLQKGFIWVPSGADWGGVSDRHVVCDRDDVMRVLNVLPPIVKHPAANMNYTLTKARNTETLLKYTWMREGIWDRVRRYDRNMAVTAVATDTSRWKKARFRGFGPAEGLLMKYDYEFAIVNRTCRGKY